MVDVVRIFEFDGVQRDLRLFQDAGAVCNSGRVALEAGEVRAGIAEDVVEAAVLLDDDDDVLDAFDGAIAGRGARAASGNEACLRGGAAGRLASRECERDGGEQPCGPHDIGRR